MTGMLASVLDVEEALLALSGGADVIDCKDPRRGALGDLPAATITAIVAAVGGRRPVSATVGDLPTEADALVPAIRRVGETGVDFVKIGVFHPVALPAQLPAMALLARDFRLIAVLFADRGVDLSVVPVLAAAGFAGVMLDTADKSEGDLLDHLSLPLAADFVAAAHRNGLLAGLAGSLRRARVPAMLGVGADYLGFRGALCDGVRTGRLSAEALRDIRALIAGDLPITRDAA
ncbi:(5-formylfuran-3-yl)methyl phosphate synthase [Thiocapsa sp.]|uniref:(5-formylfuran-3-yl)methyl phosphate synthase n=1 Tax=Thiocapsa sp. TaxID=2024551 RepID=UPI0025D69903|nr:(5-formylfuran-3-yl)methyl phosphate synthase [Thiocapsa sp.]